MGDLSKGTLSQWKFRWTKESYMEKPSLTGSSAQRILNRIRSLTAVAFSEEMDEDSLDSICTRTVNSDKLTKWNHMCDDLSILWKLIEKRSDFSNEDVDNLHIMCNKFMNQWLELLGAEHMTNYLHIIGSGHLTFFAAKYRNLYRFSQQGWESLNQLLKHYYFNNTNHGGASGNGGKSTVGLYTNGVISGDHCRPLMLLCQRSIMWKLGVGDLYFRDKEINIKNCSSGEKEPSIEEEVIVEECNEDITMEDRDSIMYGIL
jgi:hypothetical protein